MTSLFQERQKLLVFLKVFYYRSVYRPVCIIFNCSNSLESVEHLFLFFRLHKKVKLFFFWKVPTQCSSRVSSYSSISPNSNQPVSVWRGLQLHRKWLRWKNPIIGYMEPSSGGWMRQQNPKQKQRKEKKKQPRASILWFPVKRNIFVLWLNKDITHTEN